MVSTSLVDLAVGRIPDGGEKLEECQDFLFTDRHFCLSIFMVGGD